MDVEYTGDVREAICRCLGGVEELEAQIERLCRGQAVSRVTIAPLAPGRSGAVVALVRRLEGSRALKPWVVKIAAEFALVHQERRNVETLVKDRWPLVPQLLDTGASKILIYECGGFLERYAPTTLRSGYAQTPPDALSILMRRIVEALTPVHAFAEDTLPFVEREGFQPALADQLATLSSIPSELAAALLAAWGQTLQRATQLPRLVSTGGHGDLNAGNILFEPGPNASYPLFIDFGQMHGNASRGYPANGHPPFWDFAKLERDIKTRLFLEEASSAGLSLVRIVAVIRHLDGFEPAASLPADLAALPAVRRLATTLDALRGAVGHGFSPPAIYQAWYRISVAFATLLVLYRSPDEGIDPASQQRAAAESVLALLSGASSPPSITTGAPMVPRAPDAPTPASAVVVRSFAPREPDPSDQALPRLDLTDLFNGRTPIHAVVWTGAIRQRVAEVLPALAGLPQPLLLALQTHLSISWYLGTLLNPKRGFTVNVYQRTNAGEVFWDLSRAQPPADGPDLLVTEESLKRGPDLAVVISVTHDARVDVTRAIDALALPIGRLAHACLPEPGPDAVADGGHARWLADELARRVRELVVAGSPPRRLHLFAACPVGLMLLLGQRAAAWGPTTVYEFAFEDGSRQYFPGMASGEEAKGDPESLRP